MQLDCPASFELLADGTAGTAIVRNLSGGGTLLSLEQSLVAGQVLRLRIEPGHDVTPPMVAELRVLRCDPPSESDGRYVVAAEITRILE